MVSKVDSKVDSKIVNSKIQIQIDSPRRRFFISKLTFFDPEEDQVTTRRA